MTGQYVDMMRSEVVVTAKLYEPGDECGFGIVDDNRFWWSSVYVTRAAAEAALSVASGVLTNPRVVPIITNNLDRSAIHPGDFLILSPPNYRSAMPQRAFAERFMPQELWERAKATAHEWLPKKWRRAGVVTNAEEQ